MGLKHIKISGLIILLQCSAQNIKRADSEKLKFFEHMHYTIFLQTSLHVQNKILTIVVQKLLREVNMARLTCAINYFVNRCGIEDPEHWSEGAHSSSLEKQKPLVNIKWKYNLNFKSHIIPQYAKCYNKYYHNISYFIGWEIYTCLI